MWQADRIIASHKRTYATYWAWAEAQIEQAYRVGSVSTAFGLQMAVDHYTNRNTVLNFPQQAACAELLRLTCILAEERGMGSMLCATHHDRPDTSVDEGDQSRSWSDDSLAVREGWLEGSSKLMPNRFEGWGDVGGLRFRGGEQSGRHAGRRCFPQDESRRAESRDGPGPTRSRE